MAHRETRIIGDPVLRIPCEEVRETGASIEVLVGDLPENVDMDGHTGPVVNQIGVSRRAFSYNIDDEISYVLNPHIIEVSEDEYQNGDEGCLLVPHL